MATEEKPRQYYTVGELAREWGWTKASMEHHIELGFLRRAVVRDRIRIFRRSDLDPRFFRNEYADHDAKRDESELSESLYITKDKLPAYLYIDVDKVEFESPEGLDRRQRVSYQFETFDKEYFSLWLADIDYGNPPDIDDGTRPNVGNFAGGITWVDPEYEEIPALLPGKIRGQRPFRIPLKNLVITKKESERFVKEKEMADLETDKASDRLLALAGQEEPGQTVANRRGNHPKQGEPIRRDDAATETNTGYSGDVRKEFEAAFPPRDVQGLALLFSSDTDDTVSITKWEKLVIRASRNGLKACRATRGRGKAKSTFWPYRVGKWLVDTSKMSEVEMERHLKRGLPPEYKHLQELL